jgi:hypothetical protein
MSRIYTDGIRKIKEHTCAADALNMEISPIAGIRVAPVNKVRTVDPTLTERFEIEPLASPADDRYSSSNGKGAETEEFDQDSAELEDIASEAAVEFTNANNQISIFA